MKHPLYIQPQGKLTDINSSKSWSYYLQKLCFISDSIINRINDEKANQADQPHHAHCQLKIKQGKLIAYEYVVLNHSTINDLRQAILKNNATSD